MYSDLAKLCIEQDRSIFDAVILMETTKLGIVLVVDESRKLVGTITDGDVRRAMLANMDFKQSVNALLACKAGSRYARPIAAPVGADRSTYLSLLQEHSILHLPLLEEDGRVAGLVRIDDFVPDRMLPLQAVVMAGGAGSRMRPLTDDLPKPMLPLGDRPLMEIIVRQLRDAGIRHVHVTTHHKSEKIMEHFGDGSDFGVELAYVAEERPMGTAGALGVMTLPQETVLVINGDILTQVDFRAMLAFHREQRADLTMAVRKYDMQVPFGVVECQGTSVVRLTEKPLFNFFVNAGIYLLEPVAYRYIPNGERFDMTDLIQLLIDEGRSVASFPIREYWLDIGGHPEYERAERDIRGGKVRV
ncbi:nucleotidyltransferase family protein [Candidatus Uhrbacteria bacterium]|nr:nucleotidyltransferase family protein [Candidatus Uhrbacteria bacterium]